MMTNQTAKELLDKYHSGTITDEELAILESWYVQQAKNSSEFQMSENDIEQDLLKISKNFLLFKEDNSYVPFYNRKNVWTLAASILVIFSLGISYLFFRNQPELATSTIAVNEVDNKNDDVIIPGNNRAILTLGDNSQIVLDDLESGNIHTNNGVKISKAPNGQLLYDISSIAKNADIGDNYNTITTPAGGEYQVKLSDGTTVWLNAKSSIKFPTIFTGIERQVEITGEVYFDVSHNAKKPFIVKSGDQTVKVLGTQFNINSYSKEKGIKTTLIEGSVLVKSNLKNLSKVLKPGQESLLDQNHQKFSINRVDLERVVAWKNGYFIFENEELEDIMNQIARWYDVEIEYTNFNKRTQFGGAISRYRKLEDVLNLLELTDKVKFKIQGRRIIVMN